MNIPVQFLRKDSKNRSLKRNNDGPFHSKRNPYCLKFVAVREFVYQGQFLTIKLTPFPF